jgi:uncharacterized coiled-coil DUF342 family protein
MANRKKQIEAIQQKASDFSDEIDALIDEMQDSYDNMPEGIQSSSRGDLMQERIDH